MKGADSRGARPRRRVRRWLLPVLFLLLAVFLLPVFLKCTVNRVVLPHYLADPKSPVASSSVDELSYTGLTMNDFVADLDEELGLTFYDVKAEYSPATLAQGRIPLVSTRLKSGPEVEFEARVSARDIRLQSGGRIHASIDAQCSRITAGPFSAGPFDAATQIDGTDAALAFDIPLQDGLLTAHVTANADWRTNPVFNASVRVPLAAADGSPAQLAGLVPDVDDLLVSGMVAVDVAGNDAGAEVVSSLTISNLDLPASSLNLSNLSTSCTMRFPGEPRSLPEQELTADRLSVGDLQLDQIRMHYQLEPDSVFFIEDLEFHVAGGRVSLYDARIHPEMTDVSVQLFCDRLSLEQVLASCGLSGFSAGGELNGRLPLRWTAEEGLTIDRGFLFTTPGRGGTFSFGGAQAAAGILPPGSLEEGQIGLVTAALAEFKYDWITMTLNSEGDNLVVTIETAGRPVNVLPYEYDSKRGTYVKVALKPGRGTRQPMQFKLNLTVPLNQLLCYASGVNRQWNLFKESQ